MHRRQHPSAPELDAASLASLRHTYCVAVDAQKTTDTQAGELFVLIVATTQYQQAKERHSLPENLFGTSTRVLLYALGQLTLHGALRRHQT